MGYDYDGFQNEQARNQAAIELWSTVDCPGAECCGWVLSVCDVFSRCRGPECGGAGSVHPEDQAWAAEEAVRREALGAAGRAAEDAGAAAARAADDARIEAAEAAADFAEFGDIAF